MASLNDIRSTYLDFFARNGHKVVESSPFVPRNDPTLMFANSGMVQFKNCFTGVETRDYKRATTAQKRVPAASTTIWTMSVIPRATILFLKCWEISVLATTSLIRRLLAWELLTKDFGLNKDKLLVTVLPVCAAVALAR